MAFPGSYLDYLAVTRTDKYTPMGDFLNEALAQNYVLSILMEANGIDNITQGGTAIVDFIQVGQNNSFGFYAPGDQLTPAQADTMKQISAPWRFASFNYAFENVARFEKLDEIYESSAYNSCIDGTEASLWAVPSNADMEAVGGRQPYSIPVFVNEFTNGTPSGFTTVMGVNPSTYPVWRPQQQPYTMANISDPKSNTGLLHAFQRMTSLVQFHPVRFGKTGKYQEDNKVDALMILTNLDGQTQYQNCLYATNDRTVSPADAGNKVLEYRGREIKYVTALDYAGIYSGAAAGTTASATNPLTGQSFSNCAAVGAPRYYWINGMYAKPIFNKNRFMYMDEPIRVGVERPNSYVQWYFNQQQLWFRSRKRHGIIYPSA
jgi:hypothetical protein